MTYEITAHKHVGTDGVLHVDLPEWADKDVTVKVIVEPSTIADKDQKRREWLEFIERTAGCLADDPIERPPQGDYEVRDWPPGFFKQDIS